MKDFTEVPMGKELFDKPRLRCEDNIKIDSG